MAPSSSPSPDSATGNAYQGSYAHSRIKKDDIELPLNKAETNIDSVKSALSKVHGCRPT